MAPLPPYTNNHTLSSRCFQRNAASSTPRWRPASPSCEEPAQSVRGSVTRRPGSNKSSRLRTKSLGGRDAVPPGGALRRDLAAGSYNTGCVSAGPWRTVWRLRTVSVLTSSEKTWNKRRRGFIAHKRWRFT